MLNEDGGSTTFELQQRNLSQRSMSQIAVPRPARDRRWTCPCWRRREDVIGGSVREPSIVEHFVPDQGGHGHGHGHKEGQGVGHFLFLAVGATGVVFGDIGTSPLYTLAGVFTELPGSPGPEDVAGIFSMVFWTLTWVVFIKYVSIVMRVSHHGEGGTFALMQAILSSEEAGETAPLGPVLKATIAFLAMFGCALLIGDGVITPVISVLASLEGLSTPFGATFEMLVGPVVLVLIFQAQRSGTQAIGIVAGPIMVAWFLTIGALGAYNMLRFPHATVQVIAALSPVKALNFCFIGKYAGYEAWRALAGTVLCVTGAEALYADMGHFGAGPITFAWCFLAYPCLILQYMGQTTVLINNPNLVSRTNNPFWSGVPEAIKLPMTVLATVAAALASQALISGIFSLLTQAHALEFLPRLRVKHTNPDAEGQVYIPEVNRMLGLMCIILCLAFQNSSALAGAYGISVTGTFLVTSLLLWIVLRVVWHWHWLTALAVVLPMLLVDAAFWSSNLLKIASSGWVPLVITFFMCLLMYTYHWGRGRELQALAKERSATDEEVAIESPLSAGVPIWLPSISTTDALVGMLHSGRLHRTDTLGVFLTPSDEKIPRSLGMLAMSLGCLPRTVVLLSFQYMHIPFINDEDRLEFEVVDSQAGVYKVCVRFGYAEPTTTRRLALRAQLSRVAEEQLSAHPALAPLVSNPLVDLSRSHHALRDLEDAAQEVPRCVVTFFLNKLHYAAHPSDSWLMRMGVKLYSSMVANSRRPIRFFGLEALNTMEIASVCLL